MNGLRSIPDGWVLRPDGSYSKKAQGQAGKTEEIPQETHTAGSFQPQKVTKQPKRIRQGEKPLNKLETAYWQILCAKHGQMFVKPQAMRFRLGNGIFYKPDFVIILPDAALTCIEVKGPHAFRGGFENLKVAASLYPEIEWLLVWREKNGAWQEQIVLS